MIFKEEEEEEDDDNNNIKMAKKCMFFIFACLACVCANLSLLQFVSAGAAPAETGAKPASKTAATLGKVMKAFENNKDTLAKIDSSDAAAHAAIDMLAKVHPVGAMVAPYAKQAVPSVKKAFMSGIAKLKARRELKKLEKEEKEAKLKAKLAEKHKKQEEEEAKKNNHNRNDDDDDVDDSRDDERNTTVTKHKNHDDNNDRYDDRKLAHDEFVEPQHYE